MSTLCMDVQSKWQKFQFFPKSQWPRLGHSLTNNVHFQSRCLQEQYSSQMQRALVLSGAGSATELHLILTTPEHTTVTSQRKANGTLGPDASFKSFWVERAFMHSALGASLSLVGIFLLVFLRSEGCCFNREDQNQCSSWQPPVHSLPLPAATSLSVAGVMIRALVQVK